MSAPPPYSAVDGDDTSKYPPQPQAPYQAYPTQPAYPQPYPQQPVAAQPVGAQQSTVIVTAVPGLQMGGIVSDMPVQTTCSNCHNSIMTTVDHEVGGLTWLIFAILCFVGCWLFACIPFCVDDCKDVIHTCPSCNVVLGRRRRL